MSLFCLYERYVGLLLHHAAGGADGERGQRRWQRHSQVMDPQLRAIQRRRSSCTFLREFGNTVLRTAV